MPVTPCRVAIVTHYFRPHVGGIETVADEQARALSRLGFDVVVHTTDLPAGSADMRRDGTAVHRYRACNILERRLAVPVPLPVPAIFRALEHAFADVDVVVAHGHVYPTSAYAEAAAAKVGRPFVLVQHNPFVVYGTILDRIERLADRTIGRRVLARAALVVCVSRATERFVDRVLPGCPTVVVPNGVDTARFAPNGNITKHDGPRRVITVRRLVPRSGIDMLLAAWRLADLGDRVVLDIGGTGSEARRLRRAAADLRSVRFSGHIDTQALPDFYRGAWVSVMPTLTGEGFGLMAAESLACGTPVIAADEGALPELIRHDVNGVLYPVGDERALADALRSVVESPSRRAALARNAAASVRCWDDVGAMLAEHLAAVVATHSRAREVAA